MWNLLQKLWAKILKIFGIVKTAATDIADEIEKE
jgi:hypothetical protein